MNSRIAKTPILALTSTYPRWEGDVEPPFVHELSRRLAGQFDVHVLAPHAPGSRKHETLNGVFVHRFRYAPDRLEKLAYQGGILANLRKSFWVVGLIPIFLIAQSVAAFRLMTRRQIQIIHAHWLFPQGLVAIFVKVLLGHDVKVLCTSHGGDLYGLRGAFFGAIKKMVAAGCDHLTVVSRSMREDLIKLGIAKEKISVIPMGVDLQHRFVPPKTPASAQSLLFVGRLVEKKGLRYLLEAMPKIIERFPDSHLTVVGDGPERTNLEKLTKHFGVQGRVEFLGALPNSKLPSIYQKAGIVVFPSVVGEDGDREGFGLVLVEAMGCGCAAVVTDLPAMMDIVQNKKMAIVVREKEPDEIAAAVLKLLTNPEFPHEIANESRRSVMQMFDWKIVIHKFKTLLDAFFT